MIFRTLSRVNLTVRSQLGRNPETGLGIELTQVRAHKNKGYDDPPQKPPNGWGSEAFLKLELN